MRTRYRFLHRAGDRYYWEATQPIDSRTELISCRVAWFWGQDKRYAYDTHLRITRELPQ